MSHPSKRKGDTYELEVVRWHREHNINAQRVPLSGAAGGMFKSDVRAYYPQIGDMLIECKRRAHAFVQIRKWLDDHDMLWVREDAKPGKEKPDSLVVMTAGAFARFCEILVGDEDA